MRKLIIHIIVAACITCLEAQTPEVPAGVQTTPIKPRVETPAIVMQNFNTSYPNVLAEWKMDGENYVASYKDSKTNRWARTKYSPNGNIVYSETKAEPTIYPKAIDKYYERNFPDEKYEIWTRENKDKNVVHYSVRNSDTLFFDKKGKIIPKVPRRNDSTE
jgi:hypothetical protein